MDGITARSKNYNDYQMRKWLRSLPTFGWRDDKHRWYLIVPDWEHPSKSVVLVHDDFLGENRYLSNEIDKILVRYRYLMR